MLRTIYLTIPCSTIAGLFPISPKLALLAKGMLQYKAVFVPYILFQRKEQQLQPRLPLKGKQVSQFLQWQRE